MFVMYSLTYLYLFSSLIRHYLKGEKAGQTDVFVSGLPGYPDNIRPNVRGGFYVAIIAMRPQDVNKQIPVKYKLIKMKHFSFFLNCSLTLGNILMYGNCTPKQDTS